MSTSIEKSSGSKSSFDSVDSSRLLTKLGIDKACPWEPRSGDRGIPNEKQTRGRLRDFSLTAFARNDINRQHINLSESSAAKYVREQEKHDQMMDRISRKEAEDPFRGS